MGGKRRIILQALDTIGDHLTVEELHERVVQADDRICLSTVYRTVSLLISAGILKQLDLGDGKKRYETADSGRHEHLVDLGSGRVTNFHDPGVETLLREAVAKLGYRLVDYRLDVFARPLSESDDAGT